METEETCDICEKKVASQSMQVHRIHCERNTVKCPACGQKLNRSELQKHNSETHALKKCESCDAEIEIRFFSQHDCPKKPTLCDYCEGSFPLDQFRSHNVACGNRTDPCPRCREYVRKKDYVSHRASNMCVPYEEKLREAERLKQEEMRKIQAEKIEKIKAKEQRERERLRIEEFQREQAEIIRNEAKRNEAKRDEEVKSRGAPVNLRPKEPVKSQRVVVEERKENNTRAGRGEVKQRKSFNEGLKTKHDTKPSQAEKPIRRAEPPVPPKRNDPQPNRFNPKVSEKIAPKVARTEPRAEKMSVPNPINFENDFIDDIPSEFNDEDLQSVLLNNFEAPANGSRIRNEDYGYAYREQPPNRLRDIDPAASMNFNQVDDEILQQVLAESTKDNLGLSGEEKILNEIIYKSLKEK